jgi:uncharacterized repeat protein (TIGR03803 family)
MIDFNSSRNLAARPRVGCFLAVTEPLPSRKPVLALLMRLLWAAALVLPTFGASASVVFTNLHSFTGTDDGSNPYAGLVQGSDGSFYGTTDSGGRNNDGTVFKISANGALTSLYSFTDANDGGNPYAGLVQGSDGNLYGTTEGGGTNNYGTVFKISTNGVLTSLHSFTGTNDGGNPYAGLVQGSDGDLYGTTSGGGTNGAGTVFKISTNGALTNLYSFTGGNDGANPVAGLVQSSDGTFYGTTFNGGTNGSGTVFALNTDGTGFTILHTFTRGGLNQFHMYTNSDGANPQGGLVLSGNTLYGTAARGGSSGFGTVFALNTNGALNTLHLFTGGNDGGVPLAGLVQGNDGNFYGTTANGSVSRIGTVFRLTVVPAFQAVTLTNSTLSLTWSTEAGGTYQLQYNSDLSSSNWINLRSPVTATGATLSTTDSLTNAPRRFYRLVLSP